MEAVGPEAFELGLLMGTESDPLEEEQTQVFTFHHLMLLEYTASRCVARMPKVRYYSLRNIDLESVSLNS